MNTAETPQGTAQAFKSSQENDTQILLILVGLPGSGKSTLAEALLGSNGDSSRRRWVRASQDDAPNRRRQECEAVVRQGLSDGCNVVVDRVDFDPVQRSHFINIAYSCPRRPLVLALILTVSPGSLQRRLELRPDHPTLKDPETALRVVRQMQRDYRPPRAGDGEGFDGILELSEQEQPTNGVWSEELVRVVVQRCRLAPGDNGYRRAPSYPGTGMRGNPPYRGHRPYHQPQPYDYRSPYPGPRYPNHAGRPLRPDPYPNEHWRPPPKPAPGAPDRLQ